MYDVVYISTPDRERLTLLQESARSAKTTEEKQALLEEIEEISSRSKPLKECDIEECVELRTQLWGKFDRLNRIGRYSHALQFKRMMAMVETRQGELYREQAKKEAERIRKAQEDRASSLTERIKSSDEDRPRKTKSPARRSRWTTGVGELD